MRVGDRGLVLVPTSLSAGLSVGLRGPRDASGEICSQRRIKSVQRTWFSMAAAAHRVTVAVSSRPIFFFLNDAKTKIGAKFFPDSVLKFVLKVSAICT